MHLGHFFVDGAGRGGGDTFVLRASLALRQSRQLLTRGLGVLERMREA